MKIKARYMKQISSCNTNDPTQISKLPRDNLIIAYLDQLDNTISTTLEVIQMESLVKAVASSYSLESDFILVFYKCSVTNKKANNNTDRQNPLQKSFYSNQRRWVSPNHL
ncbi:hypothetical protein F8M41_009988 [Gigaspora margarita]|uniref:Uncharacterized protein n=1 Tax=Gigaspora margarita TaxID=4874 RepID=A0A8H4A1L8_GIGMA|nr:hypothetical protein F8M41_009988 [Gigaspora margarita]